MKKIIVLLLIVALILPLMTFGASAASSSTKLIAFTFDDGPSKYTESLLDGLKERGVVATFFMTGVNGGSGITNHSELLTRMWKEGHQLANHTYSHSMLSKLTGTKIQEQVSSVKSLITDAVGGSYNVMVRTPGGENTSTIRANVGAPIILWSVDTLDWKYRDEDRAYNAIISSAKDGAIVLMHDLYKTSVAAALRAVDTLKKDGYEFVTVSELLRRRSITVESGTVYTNASSQNGTLASYSAPTYTVRENQYDCSVTAELKAEKGLTLYYTTDGSYPNLSSKKYTKALSITSDTTLTIIGVDAYGTRTPVTTAKISSKVAAFTPTIKYSDGLLSLTTKTTGANIYYTTDGSTPTTSSTRYTGPFEPSGTVKFIAQKDGKLASSVGSCTVTKYGSLFTDISEKAWYYDSVSEVVERGWMTGTDSYKFSPNDAMNRAMMITALYKFDGAEEAESSAPFTDVAEDAWYKSAVDWAYDAGIIEGAGDGHFNPNGTLTREQLVTILYRYAKYRHAKTDTEQNIDYDDAADISAFAESAMAWAVAERLINGEDNGLLHPQDAATRAQCAAVLLRLDLESAKPVTISSALNKFIKPAIV